jgi:hypothetical protein
MNDGAAPVSDPQLLTSRFRREAAGAFLLMALAGLLFVLPVLRNLDYWGVQDWDVSLMYRAVPRATILEYRQFPLWNPYYCGGAPLLGHYESSFLSPTFLLDLLFGVVRGVKLEIWLHVVIGLLGAYALARRFALSFWPACLTAFVFMLNSAYALHLTVGHAWALGMAYMPWAVACYLKAVETGNSKLETCGSKGRRLGWALRVPSFKFQVFRLASHAPLV